MLLSDDDLSDESDDEVSLWSEVRGFDTRSLDGWALWRGGVILDAERYSPFSLTSSRRHRPTDHHSHSLRPPLTNRLAVLTTFSQLSAGEGWRRRAAVGYHESGGMLA